MTNKAYNELIEEIGASLRNSLRLCGKRWIEIKALKEQIKELEEENAHLSHELELEQSWNQGADAMEADKDQRLEKML